MATAAKLRGIWLGWMIGIFTLAVVGVIGNLILDPFLAVYLGFPIGPALSEGSAAAAGLAIPLFNVAIILTAIGMTVWCASRPVEEVDYFAGQGGII